jgi:hypothetical protein
VQATSSSNSGGDHMGTVFDIRFQTTASMMGGQA